MSISHTRTRLPLLALFLSLVTTACPGPQGPPGPAGPPGGAGGGPPYVWVCTPAHYPNTASVTGADLYVFNGGAAAANVAVNILNSAGVNLAGQPIPGTSPSINYPGQTGGATVSVAPGGTLGVAWQTPQVGGSPAPDPARISWSVRVTSDQPIVVGSNFQFSGFHPIPCGYLPK